MDFANRITLIQQVMSSFSHLCPKSSINTLKSAENYHNWDVGVRSILATFGSGLLEFFTDGDLLVSPDTPADDPSVVQLTFYLNRALQVVLINTVDGNIISNYQCEGLSGSALLAAIRRDYSRLSARQLYSMVDKLTKSSSMPLDKGLLFLKTMRSQFTHGMTIDHLLGLLYLQMFRDPSVNSRILDAADPQISLSAIEASLKDIATSSSSNGAPSAQAFIANKPKSRNRKPKTSKDVICRRCQQSGHISPNCTAAVPISTKPTNNINNSEVSTNDVAWHVSQPIVHAGDTYTLDSGANLHMTKNFEHFSDYVSATSVETVSGISGDNLQIIHSRRHDFLLFAT